MSQNISLWGATYSDVPSVLLPKSGGGTASFTDVTDTTAIASDVLSGKWLHLADGSFVQGTNAGGSGDGYVWQDGNGYVHLSDEQGTQTIIDALTVSSSGTTTAPTGHAYSPVTVPSGTASTPATSVTANPSISVSSGGLITATASATKSVTPSVSAGWVSSGTAGTITVSGSNTSQLSTQAGATITPTESEQTAVASGKYTTGAIKVGAISSSYVGSGITRRDSTDLSASGATISVPSGYYASNASKSVSSGTEGTPTATKGAVSNHSISVTPSVTNTGGYISGLTKTGTAVTVSASELDSGTKPITANGTGIDVVGYAAVDVAVPTGSATLITKSITANGTYNASSDNADGYSSVTVNVSGGGGGAGKKQINFIDYDGTILHSYTKSEWQSVTALPSNPSHTGLTAQGWNWTKAQIDAQLTAMPDDDVWVGQMYITTSGDTEIDVSFVDSARLSPYLTCAVNGTITIDWGDNSTSTVTGTSLTSRKSTQHVYASTGDYTITIHVESGSWAFYGTSSYTLLNKQSSVTSANRVYSNCVQNVRIGADTSIGNNAFYACYSLTSVTIPNNVTSIGNTAFYGCQSLTSVTIPNNVTSIGTDAFYNCYSLVSVTIPSGITSIANNTFNNCCSLVSVTIPSGVTSIGGNAFGYCQSLTSVTIPSGVTSIGGNEFSYCYSLTSVTIPNNVTSIGSDAFYYCYSLTSVTIPNNVTSIEKNTFYNCYSLASMTIPSGVTSIGNSAFYNCYGMAEYHIKPTTPPTLGTTVFNNIQSDCVIYVPSASLTAYQTANSWSTYASYMVGE